MGHALAFFSVVAGAVGAPAPRSGTLGQCVGRRQETFQPIWIATAKSLCRDSIGLSPFGAINGTIFKFSPEPYRSSVRTKRPIASVCGLVAAANYEPDTRAHPTFLALVSPDQPGANQALTALIFGDDRAKFGTPEMALLGKRICVTGFVSFFRHLDGKLASART